jgi:hypothetical protein
VLWLERSAKLPERAGSRLLLYRSDIQGQLLVCLVLKLIPGVARTISLVYHLVIVNLRPSFAGLAWNVKCLRQGDACASDCGTTSPCPWIHGLPATKGMTAGRGLPRLLVPCPSFLGVITGSPHRVALTCACPDLEPLPVSITFRPTTSRTKRWRPRIRGISGLGRGLPLLLRKDMILPQRRLCLWRTQCHCLFYHSFLVSS